jgi:hypothetical protein
MLDLGIKWRQVVSFLPQPLYPWGKSPWYPMEKRSGRCGAEKNLLPLMGFESWLSSPEPIAILSYPSPAIISFLLFLGYLMTLSILRL